MTTHDFGTPEERRRALEELKKAMYGPKPDLDQPPKPRDAVEEYYEFEKRSDHTVGLIFLIVFFGIGSIVLYNQVGFGGVIVALLFACIVWYVAEHARERRRADAQKRRADALAREAARHSRAP